MFFVFRLTSLVYNIVLYYSLSFTAGAESHSGLRLLAGGVCRKKTLKLRRTPNSANSRKCVGKFMGKFTKNKTIYQTRGFAAFRFFSWSFCFHVHDA